MWVYCEDPRGQVFEGERSCGSGSPPSGWSPVIWIPMERHPEGCEAKGRGLDIVWY